MTTSANLDQVNKKISKKNNKNIYFFIIFVVSSFILAFIIGGFILGKEKDKKQQAVTEVTEQVKIDPSSLPDSPDKWQAYKLETLGIELKLPEKLAEDSEWKEQVISASNGSVICFSNETSENSACTGDIFIAGGSSTDFSEGREGTFTDFQGFSKENGKFYIKTTGGNSFELASVKFREIDNINGVEIIKILGENEVGEDNEIAIPGTPGQGYLGAIVNTNNLKYPGLSIQLKIDGDISEYEFDQILESIKFINQ